MTSIQNKIAAVQSPESRVPIVWMEAFFAGIIPVFKIHHFAFGERLPFQIDVGLICQYFSGLTIDLPKGAYVMTYKKIDWNSGCPSACPRVSGPVLMC